MNDQNLKPIRSVSEAREKGRRGGIASGVARRHKASLREALQMFLAEPYKTFLGDDTGRNFAEQAAFALAEKAAHGDLKAIAMLLKLEEPEQQKTGLAGEEADAFL